MKKEIEKITILPGRDKFGKKECFDAVTIKKGESIAIVGETGAGKSQLLYDIERLAQKDTKSKRILLVDDKNPNGKMRFDPKEKLIASLSQSMHFLTDVTVKEFLLLHLESRGKVQSQVILDNVIGYANKITGEPISFDMNLLNLSGGQSRALMIADIAIISDSPIVLIDELENAGIRKEKAITFLKQENKIILMVTHDPSLALNTHKRLIIKNGGIVKILNTTKKERNIAHYLNCLEAYNLEIRDNIRLGKRIECFNINDRQATCKALYNV